jgi:hypothetical protein
MGYLKDLVHKRIVDTCEDLIRHMVDAATRSNDFNFSCYTLYCETSVEAEGGHFDRFYSTEIPDYIKSCATVKFFYCIQRIVTSHTRSCNY